MNLQDDRYSAKIGMRVGEGGKIPWRRGGKEDYNNVFGDAHKVIFVYLTNPIGCLKSILIF